MSERIRNPAADEAGPPLTDRDVVEVPLLLPGWQVAALATAAQDRGQTAGEMLRGLLHDFIEDLEQRKTSTIR